MYGKQRLNDIIAHNTPLTADTILSTVPAGEGVSSAADL
jgi:hypothetical protein